MCLEQDGNRRASRVYAHQSIMKEEAMAELIDSKAKKEICALFSDLVAPVRVVFFAQKHPCPACREHARPSTHTSIYSNGGALLRRHPDRRELLPQTGMRFFGKIDLCQCHFIKGEL